MTIARLASVSDELSPAMARLTEMQRRFVVAALMQSVFSPKQAALDAGYSDVKDGAKVRGFELAHNPKVLAALKEEMSKRIALGAIVGIYGLQAIAGDPEHKDHLKACIALADRGGYSPIVQQEIKVEHTHRTGAEQMAHLLALAAAHGEEGMALLKKAGIGKVARETPPARICDAPARICDAALELKVEESDGESQRGDTG
jgi:hypothetical protein